MTRHPPPHYVQGILAIFLPIPRRFSRNGNGGGTDGAARGHS